MYLDSQGAIHLQAKTRKALKVAGDGGWVLQKLGNAEEENVMIQTPSLKRKVKEGRSKSLAVRACEQPVRRRRCVVVCRSKKEFVNGCGAERKKGNAFVDFAIAGTGQVYCVVNSFLVGISFFWAILLGPHACAGPSGSGNVVIQDRTCYRRLQNGRALRS